MATREALIVSTARTPIGKAYRGAFNNTPSPTLASHAIKAAVERARIDPAEVDDVVIGAALQQGVQTTIGAPPRSGPASPSPSPACRSTASAPPA
jgi:acetyl-CoA C-acetyltransferase